ncbi:MAG: hypothetical protein MJZ81_06465 [Bacteroidales bacterium]|nr:hypothetical protein [Bacteroidales bacterium]
MEDNSIYLYVISPILTAVLGGITWIIKRRVEESDKKHAEEIEERNQRRKEIEEKIERSDKRIKGLRTDLTKMQSIILSCDKPDCPTKKRLADYLDKKAEEID